MSAAAPELKRRATKHGKRGAKKVQKNNERSDECHERAERRKRDAPEDEPGEGCGAGRAGETQPPMMRQGAREAQEEGEL